MKRILSLILVLTMLLALCPLNAFAATSGTCGNNVTWSFNSSTGTLTISGTGEMSSCSTSPWETYRDSIKKVIINKGVTSIGDYAFYNHSSMTSVSIPESVTKIGFYAFNSSGLTSVTMPKTITRIDSSAFNYCENLKSVYITDLTAWLNISFYSSGSNPLWNGADLYLNNKKVTALTIPSGVQTIPFGAFNGCISITSVSIPNGVTTIGQGAFYICENITSINIPSSVTKIDNAAFEYCESLTNITIPNGVTAIANSTFWGCDSLTTINIPNSVTSIGTNAFYSCENLTSVTIPSSVTTIGDYAFERCQSLTTINIPDSVTSLGKYAFDYCKSLTSVTIGNKLTEIKNNTFWYCDKLQKITIPSSVTTIGESAFAYCSALTDVTYLGTDADWNKIEIGEGNEYLVTAYNNSKGKVAIVTQPKNVAAVNGATAKVTLTAKGDGLTYTWYYKNKGASSFTKTTSFTSNSYAIAMNSDRDGRQVYCVVKDKYGNSVRSNTVTLSLKAVAKITSQPVSVTVEEGKTAKVTVGATGDGIRYIWYFKNKGETSFAKTTSFTGPSYSVAMNSARDGRQVYCVVKDKYGNYVKSNTVTLSMKKVATITSQPKTAVAKNGATAKVTVGATGDGIRYIWYFKNKGASSFTKTTSFTGPTYSVSMNDSRNGRQVYCVVKDKYGTYVKSNTVTLYMGNAAKITTQPKNVVAKSGATAKVTVGATGDGLTYTWYYKNKGASSFTKTTSFKGNSYAVAMDSTRDGRQVYCVVKDKYGTYVKTNTVTLTMGNVAKITTQPKGVTVADGETAKVTLKATGDGLTYTWYYKNKGASSFSKTTSFTGNSYSIVMNSDRDGRQVYCVVKDKYGNSVKSNTVTLSKIVVTDTVTITKQPAGKSVPENAQITYSVAATGSSPITYQWQKRSSSTGSWSNSGAVGNKTSTLLIDAVASIEGYQFRCKVTSGTATTYSDVVTLSLTYTQAAYDHIVSSLESGALEVDISEYGVSTYNLKQLWQDVHNMEPQLFYIDTSFSYSYNLSKVKTVYFTYSITDADERNNAIKYVNDQIDYIVSTLPTGLDEFEKAMYFHDYICTNFEYDTALEIRDVYTMFKTGKGVCEGYTYILDLLLERVGIENFAVRTPEYSLSPHIWNIVKLDGEWYHIDATWGDPVPNSFGRADHDDFLLSDDVYGNSHDSFYSYYLADDTSYDDLGWHSTDTPFGFANGKTYMLDGKNIKEVDLRTGQMSSSLYTINDSWNINGYIYQGLSGFGSYKNRIVFNTSESLMYYNPLTGTTGIISTPSLGASDEILGCYVSGNVLYYVYGSTLDSSNIGSVTLNF